MISDLCIKPSLLLCFEMEVFLETVTLIWKKEKNFIKAVLLGIIVF